jgi:hypothetical protein
LNIYAFGHYGVQRNQNGPPTFDPVSDLNYHHDPYAMVQALCVHADHCHNTTAGQVPDDERENWAAMWTSHKQTLKRNMDMPFQQIVAPDGRIFWWIRLV